MFIVPTHLWGEELHNQMVFFVSSILADQNIHRRESRPISIESPSSIEYGILKMSLFFVFRESHRGLTFCEL